MQEKILNYIEKNSRIDIHELAVILGEDEHLHGLPLAGHKEVEAVTEDSAGDITVDDVCEAAAPPRIRRDEEGAGDDYHVEDDQDRASGYIVEFVDHQGHYVGASGAAAVGYGQGAAQTRKGTAEDYTG